MDQEFWKVALLAVVQGIAEFLPISSSGHVVIASSMLGNTSESIDTADLNIVLHVGTLGSIIVVYFDRIMRLLRQDRQLLVYLFAATVPAVLVGVPVKKFFDQALSSPLLAGFLLIGTGTILLTCMRKLKKSDTNSEDELSVEHLSMKSALLIGAAQALAILPGFSRSGLTITTGMALKLSPKTAATFSFLMAIPVIAGGGLLEVVSLAGESSHNESSIHLLVMGCALSMLVGILSLRLLLSWLDRGRFHWFAFWCIPFGLFSIAWHFFQG